MKIIIILLFAITASFSGFTQKSRTPQNKSDTTVLVKYTCTMHPNEVSVSPDKCPVCGTQLVVDRRGSKQPSESFTCPMHPDEVSKKPGKCPICGKDMVGKKSMKKSKNKKSEI